MRQDRAAGELTFPIKLRCASLAELMYEPRLEATLARALGRAFARARSALPAAVAPGGGVALQPPYLTGARFSDAETASLLARVRRAIEAAARAQSLPLSRRVSSIGPRPERAGASKKTAERFNPRTATYDVPSYQQRSSRTPANLPVPPPQPLPGPAPTKAERVTFSQQRSSRTPANLPVPPPQPASALAPTKAERVTFSEREGTTLTATSTGEVAEERGGTVKEIDEMRAFFEEVFRARIPFMTNAEIIQEALRLDPKLWKQNIEVGPGEKSAIAETLIQMYETLSAKILDNRGLPVEGVKWDKSSPLRGQLLDILPFVNIDLWPAFVLKPEAPPVRHRRRPRPLKLSFPDEVIVGGVKIPREFIARETKTTKRFEGAPHLTHIGGDIVELVGNFLESTATEITGVAIQIGALYWAYVGDFVKLAEKRTELGELRGRLWVVLAANDLLQQGRRFGDINAEELIRRAEIQKEREFRSLPDPRLGAYELEGGASGVSQREKGRATGIREGAKALIELMEKVKLEYFEFEDAPGPYPGEQDFSYKWRLSKWGTQRRCYEKLGFSFEHPEVEVPLFQTGVLKAFLKWAAKLEKVR